MRKIRFRAWDGRQFYYFSNHTYGLDFNDISGWNVYPNIPGYKGDWTTGESSRTAEVFDLQQFTGLEDKNKHEIYEGDIIQIINPFSEKRLARVIWDIAGPAYTWMVGETWMLHFIDGIAQNTNTPLYPYCQPENGFDVTIIGTIHENPELLSQNNASEKDS